MTRPTSCLAVESDLRARAEHVVNAAPGSVYYCENLYAYLFGMATALLADANAELDRKDRELARLTAELDAVADHRSIR